MYDQQLQNTVFVGQQTEASNLLQAFCCCTAILLPRTFKSLSKLSFGMLEQPAYSSDLVPSNYHV